MVDKIVDPNAAMNAYKSGAKIAVGAGTSKDGEGVSFGDFLKQKARDSVDVMRTGESTSARAVSGDADLTDVVQAVNSAELTLQTIVTIRDRLVSAFQDIMRLPI